MTNKKKEKKQIKKKQIIINKQYCTFMNIKTICWLKGNKIYQYIIIKQGFNHVYVYDHGRSEQKTNRPGIGLQFQAHVYIALVIQIELNEYLLCKFLVYFIFK